MGWIQSDYTRPNLVGEVIRGSIGSRSDCQLTPIVVPPRPDASTVTATGVVEIERNSGGATMRGLSGARCELWYWGKNGQGTATEWRRATTGRGGTGAEVGGYLAADGRYEVSFAYPNRQNLPDGSTWEGCPRPVVPVPHLDSYACEPQHIMLLIFPEDEGRAIRVFEPDRTELVPAAEVQLGHYFAEPDKRTKPISFAAHAYAGVRNVMDLAGGAVDPVTVKIVPGVHAHYLDDRSEIRIDTGDARTSVVEHEAAHHIDKMITRLPAAPDCQSHVLFNSNNDQCAWQEGFATFLAVLAENAPGERTWQTFTKASGWFDVERCDTGTGRWDQCPVRFRSADGQHAVEAWVVAALWDLVDDTPLETRDWFSDLVAHDVGLVLDTMASVKPKNYREFFSGLASHGTGEVDVSFMNRQLYTVMSDKHSRSTGWLDVPCACSNGSAALYEPAQGQAPSLSWNIKPDQLAPGEYELWVNVPVNAWLGPMDAEARYVIANGSAASTVRVDQTMRGWHRLSSTVTVTAKDAVSVTLIGGSDDPLNRKGLSADVLVLVPRP